MGDSSENTEEQGSGLDLELEGVLDSIFPPSAPSSTGQTGQTGAQSDRVADIRPVTFQPFSATGYATGDSNNMELLMDVSLPLSVQLGTARMTVREILALGPGSVVELDKAAGEPVGLLVNGKLIAYGEVVVIDENFGIRIVEIVNGSDEKGR